MALQSRNKALQKRIAELIQQGEPQEKPILNLQSLAASSPLDLSNVVRFFSFPLALKSQQARPAC